MSQIDIIQWLQGLPTQDARGLFGLGGDGNDAKQAVFANLAGKNGNIGEDFSAKDLTAINVSSTNMPQVGGVEIVDPLTWAVGIQGTGGSAGSYAASFAEGRYIHLSPGWVFGTVAIRLTDLGSWSSSVRIPAPDVFRNVTNALAIPATVVNSSGISYPTGGTTIFARCRPGEAFFDLNAQRDDQVPVGLNISDLSNNTVLSFMFLGEIEP